MNSIREFINSSKTFGGFVFIGNYTMPKDVFFNIYNYFLTTGNNLLDDYTNFIHLDWIDVDKELGIYYELEKIDKINESLSKLRNIGVIDSDTVWEQRQKLKIFRDRYYIFQNQKDKLPRKKASSHTSNKKIRKLVFEKYGEVCLKCGSTNDLTIDHVIPVKKGGKNDISNYQPLCKSCNSKKSVKTTDYRRK